MGSVSRREFLRQAGTGVAAGGGLLLFAGCGTGQDDASGQQELDLYVSADIPTLDPSKSQSTLDNNINLNILEGLYRMDPQNNPIPGQAKGVHVSKDKLTYTFTLRDGLKWSNGKPVTSHDFKYSWLRALDPKTAAPQATDISPFVRGAHEFNTGKGTANDVGLSTPDDKTLKVELVHPAPFFLQLVAHSTVYSPLNQDFVEEQAERFADGSKSIICNGAYTLRRYDPTGDTVVLEKNKGYWDAANTKVKKVNISIVKQHSTALNLYEAGKLDQVQLEHPDEKRYKGTKQYDTYVTNAAYYMYLNNNDPVIKNTNIRKALTFGFDRKTLAHDIMGGGTWPADGLVPPVTPGLDGKSFRELQGPVVGFEPDRAKKYWERGTKELGREPSLVMLTEDDSNANKVSQYMQAQLRKHVGVKISIERATFKNFLDRAAKGDYQIGSGSGWQGVYNDAQNYLEIFVTGHPQNFPHFSDKDYDELIARVKEERDETKRMHLLMQAERLLLAKGAALAPQYTAGIAVATKPSVTRWVMNMAVDVGNYKYWRLK